MNFRDEFSQDHVRKGTSSFPRKNFPRAFHVPVPAVSVAVCCIQCSGALGADPWLSPAPAFVCSRGWGPAQLLCLLQGDNGVLVKPRVLSPCPGPCCAQPQPSAACLHFCHKKKRPQTSRVLSLRMVILWLIRLEMRVRLFNGSLELN